MLEQIRLDIKKNYKSSFSLVIFIAFIMVLLPTYLTNLKTDPKTFRQSIITAVSKPSGDIQARLTILQQEETKDQDAIDLEMQRNTFLKDLLMEYTNAQYDFEKINQLNLDYAQFNLAEFQAGRDDLIVPIDYPKRESEVTKLDLEKNVQWYQYLLDHHLGEYVFGYVKAPAVNYLNFALLYSTSAIIFLLFFALQLAQLFTIEKQKGTIKFLNNLPHTKFKVLTSKIISFLALTVPSFLVALAIVFGLNVRYGIGSWQYPVEYVTNQQTIKFMTMGRFVTLYIVLLLLVLLFLASLCSFFSLFTGNYGLILIVALVPILLMASGLLDSGLLGGISQFLPFSYLDIPRALTYTTTWRVGSFGEATLVLVGWSLLFYLASFVVLRKRQLL